MLLQNLIYIFNIEYWNTYPEFDCALFLFLFNLIISCFHTLPKSYVEIKSLSFKLLMVTSLSKGDGCIKTLITWKRSIWHLQNPGQQKRKGSFSPPEQEQASPKGYTWIWFRQSWRISSVLKSRGVWNQHKLQLPLGAFFWVVSATIIQQSTLISLTLAEL